MVVFVEEKRIATVVSEVRYFQPQYNKTLLLLLLTVFRGLLLIDVLFSREIRFHELTLVGPDIQDMCIDKSLAGILEYIVMLNLYVI